MKMLDFFTNKIGEKKEEKQEHALEVLQKQVATLKPDDLKILANEQAREILTKIEDVSRNIESAKSLTKKAENVEGSWWNPFEESKAEKRSKLNTQANSMQNQAMAEMNTLIQESIKLTTITYGFAQAMTQTIAEMLANGFKDRDGNIKKLSGAAKEQAEFILVEAKNFVEHQRQYEDRQRAQEKLIDELDSRLNSKDELDNQQDKKIEALEAELETKRTKITELQGALESKKQIDDSQEQKINALESRVQILESRSNKGGSLSLIISVIALLGAVASIALQFLR